jgi:macrodomain Ter protein organizer (MatP/YcbG family)
MTKPQTKVSWVWEYFVRKQSENGEIRAYCQFISDNGENVQKIINMMDLLLSME